MILVSPAPEMVLSTVTVIELELGFGYKYANPSGSTGQGENCLPGDPPSQPTYQDKPLLGSIKSPLKALSKV